MTLMRCQQCTAVSTSLIKHLLSTFNTTCWAHHYELDMSCTLKGVIVQSGAGRNVSIPVSPHPQQHLLSLGIFLIKHIVDL